MKTVIRFLSLVMYMTFMIACNKTDQLINVSPDINLKSVPIECQVIPVLPNGNDDTEALQQAFHDALPGSVVQLGKGTYHLDFMEIREFNGTFRGAGKGITIITTVEDLDVDALKGQNLNTILIRFVGGDVCMTNMTIRTPSGPLGSESIIDGLVGFSGITYQYSATNESINALIDNVEFIGHWENCNFGLKAEFGCRYKVEFPGGWPSSNTNIKITNCLFQDFLKGGALIWHIKNGKIEVGTKNRGNVFNNIKDKQESADVGYGALGIWMNVNVNISIVVNTFHNPPGTRFGIELWKAPWVAFLKEVPQTKTTVCNIEGNEFNNAGSAGGIKMNDRWRNYYPDDSPMLVEVKNNKFNMSEKAGSGIECYCMSGTIIRNNRFTGSGTYGIFLSAESWLTAINENGLILGNNFSDAAFSVATIMVYRRTRNWTIVGGGIGENVMIRKDDINPNSNILVTGMNVNTSEVPPGQTIVDNLEEMRDAFHDADHN